MPGVLATQGCGKFSNCLMKNLAIGILKKNAVGEQDSWAVSWGQILLTFCMSLGLCYQTKLPSSRETTLSGVNYD